MNRLKWIVLPVLMIVSFVLITKPTYAFGNVYEYEQLIDGRFETVSNYDEKLFRVYNPYDEDWSTLHGFASDIFDYQDGMYLINLKGISNVKLLLYDVDLDIEYYDPYDLGVIDYLEFGVSSTRITTLSFIRIENGVPNYYKTYTFDFWDFTFDLMLSPQSETDDYLAGYDDGKDDGLIQGAMDWIGKNQHLLNVEINGMYYNITQYGQYMYDLGLQNGSEIMSNVQELFEAVLSTIGNVFSTTIFPGVTIGTLFMIPISFAMFKWFLKLIK